MEYDLARPSGTTDTDFTHSPSLPQGVGRRVTLSQSPYANPNSFQALIGSLEHSICTRLDRIESSLQELHGRAPTPKTEKVYAPTEPPSPKVGTRQAVLTGVAARSDPREEDWPMSMTFSVDSGATQCGAAELSMRPEWTEPKQGEAVAVLSSKRRRWHAGDTAELDKPPPDDDARRPWWVIPPGTRFRLCWDVLMTLIIAHDMAVVPVILAFDTEDFTSALFWPFLAYWTLDIPLSFMTGFYANGRTVMRPALIARNYLVTWFTVDLFMVGASWVEAGSQGYMLGRAGKSLRVLRMMRCLQILRIAKLRKRFEEFHDRVTSDYYKILVSISKLVLTIMWLNHFIACCWWALGVHSSNGGANDSWTAYGRFEETSHGFQYFSSLHWSLTQFTPAAMEVTARNLPERIFSVFILLFAMVAFSSFVSSITAAMTQLRQIHSQRDMKTGMLRRYLRLKEVPMDLALRVMQFANYRLGKQKAEIQEHQVELLKCLSTPLKMELSSHIFGPTLARHPFFHRYAEVEPEAMRHVCLSAVGQVSLSSGDALFTEGCRCEQMFFVTSGLLRYDSRGARASTPGVPSAAEDREVGAARTSAPRNKDLQSGEWCCEVSIWCPWEHVGTMVAVQMSEALALDVAAFARDTSPFHLVRGLSARYASFYIEKMKDHVESGGELDDLSVFSPDELEGIVERAYLKRRLSEPDTARRMRVASRARSTKPQPTTPLAPPETPESNAGHMMSL